MRTTSSAVATHAPAAPSASMYTRPGIDGCSTSSGSGSNVPAIRIPVMPSGSSRRSRATSS